MKKWWEISTHNLTWEYLYLSLRRIIEDFNGAEKKTKNKKETFNYIQQLFV